MLAHMLPLAIHDALHSVAHHRVSLVEPHVTETEHAFTIEAEAPGVAPSDVKIEFNSESNSVRIHGKSTVAAHTHFVDFTTAFGSHAVDAEKATASVEHGVISITLPKAPESEAEVPTRVRIPVSGEADEEETKKSLAGNTYRLTLVAAGFNASEITVEAQPNAQPHRGQQDGLLKISGESTRIKRKRLEEVFRLPRDADVAGATASQVDGILTIRIPKRLAPAARRIPISLKAAAGRRKLPETTTEQEASSSPASAPAASKSDEADEPVMV